MLRTSWLLVALGLAGVVATLGTPARAGEVYADRVVSVTGKPMENYQTVVMTEETYWWLTGPADDVVSGWRSGGPVTIFTMGFPVPLLDGEGIDLRIRQFGPGDFKVEAGPDLDSLVEIGRWLPGQPTTFEYAEFDFAGLTDNVRYVRIERLETGPSTGRFFDCFEGTHPLPEPASAAVLICGAAVLRLRRRTRGGSPDQPRSQAPCRG